MGVEEKKEYWLRGPVDDVPALLQPVAHALLQARDEIKTALVSFPENKLWEKPQGVASVAFHLQHLCGVLDRLFTYAKEEKLNPQQLAFLAEEGIQHSTISIEMLLKQFDEQVDKAIEQLKSTDTNTLTDARGVGRKQIPATVIGLLFHTAEHTMRHTGQLLVTITMLKNN